MQEKCCSHEHLLKGHDWNAFSSVNTGVLNTDELSFRGSALTPLILITRFNFSLKCRFKQVSSAEYLKEKVSERISTTPYVNLSSSSIIVGFSSMSTAPTTSPLKLMIGT